MDRFKPNLSYFKIGRLDFGDIDPVFQGHHVMMWLILSAFYLDNWLVDSDQTWMETSVGQGQEVTNFLWPWPYFQDNKGHYNVKIKPKICRQTIYHSGNKWGCGAYVFLWKHCFNYINFSVVKKDLEEMALLVYHGSRVNPYVCSVP